MKTINHECYVDLEVAKLLKEAGFVWHVKSCWDLSVDGEVWLNCDAIYPNNFRNNNEDIIYAPTLEVAQRWLREVKGYELWVYPFSTHYRFSFYGYLANEDNDTNFDTYEEAKEAGIKKALELILEKGE